MIRLLVDWVLADVQEEFELSELQLSVYDMTPSHAMIRCTYLAHEEELHWRWREWKELQTIPHNEFTKASWWARRKAVAITRSRVTRRAIKESLGESDCTESQ